MLTLGIDTSSDNINIGVSDGKDTNFEISKKIEVSYLSETMPILDDLLKKNGVGLQDVDLFSIVVGPGSWTGIRLGVATIKTLAYVLDKPIIGVVSLDLMVFSCASNYSGKVTSVISSNRDYLFSATYVVNNGIPGIIYPHKLLRYREFIENLDSDSLIICYKNDRIYNRLKDVHDFNVAVIPEPKGSVVSRLGMRNFRHVGKVNVHSLQPFYLQEFPANKVLNK